MGRERERERERERGGGETETQTEIETETERQRNRQTGRCQVAIIMFAETRKYQTSNYMRIFDDLSSKLNRNDLFSHSTRLVHSDSHSYCHCEVPLLL